MNKIIILPIIGDPFLASMNLIGFQDFPLLIYVFDENYSLEEINDIYDWEKFCGNKELVKKCTVKKNKIYKFDCYEYEDFEIINKEQLVLDKLSGENENCWYVFT